MPSYVASVWTRRGTGKRGFHVETIMSSVRWCCLAVFLLGCMVHADDDEFCGPPPIVPRAKASVENDARHSVGQMITYACDFGYSAQGYRRSITCEVDAYGAKWTELDLTCVPRSCGDPGFVEHATVNGSLFTFPNSVTFVCDEGYQIVGSRQRFCQTSGKWSGSLPKCEVLYCTTPHDPENGRAVYISLEYGSELHYECNKGFSLNSDEVRICSANGEWSGKQPSCKDAQCHPPDAPEHGTMELVGGRANVGSILIFACDPGYTLHGLTTSKCLKTGEWTFPPPRCLEPCTIPTITNGMIGRYDGRGRWKKFKQISAGSSIDDGMEVLLKCDRNYEPAGELVSELTVSCTNGLWSVETECIPAACRTDPSLPENAYLVTNERSHGTGLTFMCKEHFKKVAFGSTKCQFGKWVGTLPVCADTRCKAESLDFPGVHFGAKSVYQNGETLISECKKGYEISKKQTTEVLCTDGHWMVNSPPCIPERCSGKPPLPENGKIEQFSGNHGSAVTYSCNDWFYLVPPSGSSSVKCSFGEWVGTPPTCRDNRCYFKDLAQVFGVEFLNNEPTLSRNYADISCQEGYTLKYTRPRCLNGTWQYQNNLSPCQPSPCVISAVQHGRILFPVTVRTFDYWAYKYVEVTNYREAVIGSSHRDTSELFVSCDAPYTFRGGQRSERVTVRCEKGQWTPYPLCLQRGAVPVQPSAVARPAERNRTPARSTSQARRATTESSRSTSTRATTTTKIPRQTQSVEGGAAFEQQGRLDVPTSSVRTVTGDIENATESTIAIDGSTEGVESCSCVYSLNDDNVVAYAGDKLLSFRSQVKQGCTVKFFCKNIGVHRLEGKSEISCEDCKWHSSDFPVCVEPRYGDAVIRFQARGNNLASILPSGVLAVSPGITLNITCEIKDLFDWAELKGPKRLVVNYRYLRRGSVDVPQSVITLENTNPYYDGIYECSGKNGRPLSLEIKVQALQPPDIPTLTVVEPSTTSIFVRWSEPQYADASVTGYTLSWFKDSARIATKHLDGKQQEFTIENLLSSTEYNVTLNAVNDFGASHPAYRVVTTLLDIKSNCSLPLLVDVLPENVVPEVGVVTSEFMTHGTNLNLTCAEQYFRPIGAHTVVCDDGQWTVGNIQCVAGCDAFRKSRESSLRFEPDKQVYRFGEYITFLCPPGQALNVDIEKVMCLRDGWSEDVKPDCIDV